MANPRPGCSERWGPVGVRQAAESPGNVL